MSRYRADHKPDDSQLAVIHAREDAIRLVAPAGSGKTETLVRRVIERTGSGGVDPRRVLMLTFDNNGKQALTRLLKTFAPRQALPTFQTFNSFGVDILRQVAPTENATVIGKPETDTVRRAIGSLAILSWDDTPRGTVETFQAMKEQGFRPVEDDRKLVVRWLRNRYLQLPAAGAILDLAGGDPADRPDVETDRQLHEVFDAFLRYERELRSRGRMDFQDQKLRPLMHVMRNQAIIDQLRQLYDEVVVDEAQDISRLDALLIWSAIGPNTTLTLAGDDDQTIYEFRQANSVFLREAPREFAREFTTYLLNMNYRSPEAILDPAQRLIGHNVERIAKGVTSARLEPGEVIVHAAPSGAARIAHLVRTVQDFHARGIDWADMGILVPQAWQYNAIKAALERDRIPTKINTGRNDKGGVIENAVELSTIHRAKGRQWRAAFLPMSGEGEMPDAQSVRTGNLEADRRAYYVSMSRAADILVVSYIRPGEADTIERSLSGEVTATSGASRFLFEAGLVQEAPSATRDDGDGAAKHVVITDNAAGSDEASAPVAEPIVPPDATPDTAAPRQSVADRLRQKDAATLRNLGRTADAETATEPVAPEPEPAPVDPVPARISRAERAERRVADEAMRPRTTIPADILHLVDAAERKHVELDYRYALFDGWDAVYQTLKLLEPGIAAEKGDAFELINELGYHHTVPQEWIVRLHTWRKTRNQGLKEANYDRRGITDLVSGLRPFMAVASASLDGGSVAAPPAPAAVAAGTTPKPMPVSVIASGGIVTQIYPVPTAQAYDTARILANGGFDPARGKTIRTIGIHTLNHGVEFLPLQLGMILLDVKFFVPGTFRYGNSPIFARYCDRNPDVRLPADLRRLLRQPSEVSPEVEARIHALLDEMLAAVVAGEGYRGKPGALLDKRLRDAMRLANGEVNRGVRLEPLAASRGAGWSRS
ncbi:MAG: UvrD-helicase domain-containing protein [Thermomicrobiales bacterium]